MKTKKIKFLSVLFMSAIGTAAFCECVDGKIRHINQGKEVIVNESYCYDSPSGLFISSRPCVGGKVCESKNLGTIEIKMSEIASSSGSLGFKICEKYHGTPQIMEYWAESKWKSTSRCIFKDNSFIDNATIAQKVKYVD